MIKILKKAMRNPEFDEPGFAWMKIACYLSLTGRTDCCCWLFSVFFFLKTLNCCFCSWVGGRDGGDFSSCLVLFVLSMSLLLGKYFCFSRREGN